jgi:hypothetical protein
MPDENDTPLTEEELALARKGEALISAAAADVKAPQSLREAIERDRERARARAAPFGRWRRWVLAGAGAAAAVLATVAIVLQTGDDAAQPSLTDVYATARLAPTEAAPAPLGGEPPVIDAEVDNIEFPDWRQKFDWKAVGRRDDTLSGRTVTTVFYRNPEGARLGYAVVSGDSLGGDPPGRQVTRNGNGYKVARTGERTIVTWTQEGQTCVISAPSAVPQATLVDLAASRDV